jgi:hypothetical protein
MPWIDSEIKFLKENYPTKGKKYCSLSLNKNEGAVRSMASKLQLKTDRNSEFFKEWQSQAKLTKIGRKRPLQSKIMKEKYDNGEITQFEGRQKHGLSYSRGYSVWNTMMARCYNPKKSNFKHYGARGIEVCEEWKDPHKFIEWYQANIPIKFTIDRINFDGNYCPENCRKASHTEQARNRSNNNLIEFRGETKTLSEWSQILNIEQSTLSKRINKYGWTVEKAFIKTAVKKGEEFISFEIKSLEV